LVHDHDLRIARDGFRGCTPRQGYFGVRRHQVLADGGHLRIWRIPNLRPSFESRDRNDQQRHFHQKCLHIGFSSFDGGGLVLRLYVVDWGRPKSTLVEGGLNFGEPAGLWGCRSLANALTMRKVGADLAAEWVVQGFGVEMWCRMGILFRPGYDAQAEIGGGGVVFGGVGAGGGPWLFRSGCDFTLLWMSHPFGGFLRLAPRLIELHDPFAGAVQMIPVRDGHPVLPR